jgi:hypothetical protein
VGLARKLPIALWRYLETGVVPAGAALKCNAENIDADDRRTNRSKVDVRPFAALAARRRE